MTAIARAEGYRNLREDGLIKAWRGATSLDEVLRVTGTSNAEESLNVEYSYEAVNRDGQVMKGQIQAASQADALRILKDQDLTPVTVAEAGSGSKTSGRRATKSASIDDKAIVFRELATLLAAGVPLAEAVDSTSLAHGDTQIGASFGLVYAQLRGGAPLSQALQAAELELPEYVFQLVGAGELTGKLAQALHSATDQMEYEQKIRQEMRNALIYPSILVFSGIAATLLIFIVVVPKFTNMLKNTHAKIPAISVWVLKTGLFVKENLLWFWPRFARRLYLAIAF